MNDESSGQELRAKIGNTTEVFAEVQRVSLKARKSVFNTKSK